MTVPSAPRPLVACVRAREDFEAVKALPPATLDVRFIPRDDGNLTGVPPGAAAVVLASVGPPISTEVFMEFPHLRLVHFTGVGVDRVDSPALRAEGIVVRGCPAVNAPDVAEYTVTAAIVLLRRLLAIDRRIKAGDYASARHEVVHPPARGLRGLQWGVIGMGTIGREVARLTSGYRCSVVYHDEIEVPSPEGAKRMPLPELLQTSDVVSVHVPLSPTTAGLLSRDRIELLRHDAVLINAARGGVVDEDAVHERLEAGTLMGAAFDVYQPEPPVPNEGILGVAGRRQEDRALLTPHIAGVTTQAWSDLFTYTWDSVERILGLPDARTDDALHA